MMNAECGMKAGGGVFRRAAPCCFRVAHFAFRLCDMVMAEAHLDLPYYAVRVRGVVPPAAEQAPDAEGIPTVGLPDLRAGGVGLVCATVFCMPSLNGEPGYRDADEAAAAAAAQLDWYREQERAGRMRFVRSVGE